MPELLSIAQASDVINAAALGLITIGIVSIFLRRLEAAIGLIALQGVLLSIAAISGALALADWHAWAAFLVTISIKVAAIPVVLRLLVRRLAVRREVELALPIKFAVPAALGLVLIAYRVTEPFRHDSPAAFDAPDALPAALALLLLGLFTMIARRKALTQVLGLVTMENGLSLAAIAVTRGLPFAVELGVAMDVLTGVVVMGLVIHEINRQFATVDTDRLRSLRG